jgi:hypothetical protein
MSERPDVVVVVPNHHPTLGFLDEWREQLADVPIVVMQDIGAKPAVPRGFSDVTVVDHDDVKADLGDAEWIIPSRSSSCRSYGYLVAWRRQPRYILTLDNDCFPDGSDWVAGHVANLERPVTLDWVNTGPGDLWFRGVPYGIRDASQVCLSHGLWSGVPDLDAATSLHHSVLRLGPAKGVATIPRGSFFPLCGMNVAWRSEITPAMYFGLFGPDYGFDQFDDIWAGVLVKRVMDHLGLAAVSGAPSVEHRKQSDVFVNMRKQAPGMAMNESLWRTVRDIHLTAGTAAGAYAELIAGLPDEHPDEVPGWTARFKEAAALWLGLFA